MKHGFLIAIGCVSLVLGARSFFKLHEIYSRPKVEAVHFVSIYSNGFLMRAYEATGIEHLSNRVQFRDVKTGKPVVVVGPCTIEEKGENAK